MAEVTYCGDTITDDALARVKFVLSSLARRERESIFSDAIHVDGVTVTIGEVDAVLSLAQGMWFRLKTEQEA